MCWLFIVVCGLYLVRLLAWFCRVLWAVWVGLIDCWVGLLRCLVLFDCAAVAYLHVNSVDLLRRCFRDWFTHGIVSGCCLAGCLVVALVLYGDLLLCVFWCCYVFRGFDFR